MSDLQCAATVIVARHAEAEYESELLYDAGGSLTLRGRDQARALAESLRDRRIAAIWCSDQARSVQTAEIAASILGCTVRVRDGLREFGVGDYIGRPIVAGMFSGLFEAWTSGDLDTGPGGTETGRDIVDRMTAELESVADQYRGETVLVVSHGGVMALALPYLARNAGNAMAVGLDLANCATSELDADADGWVMRTWAGEAVPPISG